MSCCLLFFGFSVMSPFFSYLALDNREAALRTQQYFPGGPLPTNVELKASDHTGNPYLVLGCVLAAGKSGIDQKLSLPPPCQEDPGYMTDAQRAEFKTQRLPQSLEQALDMFEQDDVLKTAMGNDLHKTYLATKRFELAHWSKAEKDAERKELMFKF
eukprot:TRINITY_DN64929_c0_g1_i5.p2 TRINITY_DN64929_c0_g1~~TRINITY_DN64929_c0_g1_i5.p2  ORF type:complete len:157 (-),score=11.65 TRINITY_DN64929_c0_g1_i5:229-699(-)